MSGFMFFSQLEREVCYIIYHVIVIIIIINLIMLYRMLKGTLRELRLNKLGGILERDGISCQVCIEYYLVFQIRKTDGGLIVFFDNNNRGTEGTV